MSPTGRPEGEYRSAQHEGNPVTAAAGVDAAAPAAGPHLALLRANGVGKSFGGVQALADVSFTINHGEIYGLIGPNGAGKTSLFNVLTGIYTPDRGEFIFEGLPLTGLKPHEVAARGIARTFQNIRLFGNLSALENVMIGRHVRTRAGVWGAIFRDAADARRGEGPSSPARTSCSSTWASPGAPATRRGTCPTATSAGSRSRARWPPSRSCWRSTSRRRA